jgi:pyruvate dehydrogenase E2 component (dihydrolipoamide acetyltransferase)
MDYLALASETNPGHEIHAVPGRRQPQSRLRKLIRSRVSRSSQFAAAVTLTRKEDITGLLAWLAARNAQPGPETPPVTLMAAILKATGLALLDYPLLNSILDGSDIIFMDERNISLVLPLAEGVILPVIHRVDKLSLEEIALTMAGLEAATRRETLQLKDTIGSTFTISDLGSYGVDSFTPILNLPQAAILGVGRVTTEWVLPDQAQATGEPGPLEARKVEPRRFVTFSLTFDHRISDGPYSAAFLQRMAGYLTGPDLL